MQFSLSTGEKGLVEDARWMTNSDSNSYAVADITRCVNRWYYKAVIEAWKASSDWEFDDTNQSNFPIATTTMVASQADYSIPTNALKILRVEAKDVGGNWHIINPIDETEIDQALDEFYKTAGMPMYYRMVRNSIILYPAPASTSATLASGLKIYFLREVDEFITTDTTQEPGLAEPFHRILSLGAAYDFAVAKGTDNLLSRADRWRQEIESLLRDLRDYYTGRHVNFKLKIRPLKENYL